jgi:hypothetical protein
MFTCPQEFWQDMEGNLNSVCRGEEWQWHIRGTHILEGKSCLLLPSCTIALIIFFEIISKDHY